MPGIPGCTVFIGNLDERVNDRVLYEVMVQAGQIIDIYIPRDRETNRPKGYAFAEYETEEVADYAIRLFSGVVFLYNRMLKFAISLQEKPSHNLATHITPALNSPSKPRSQHQLTQTEDFQQDVQLLPCRFPEYSRSVSSNYSEAPASGRVRNGYRSGLNNNFGYSRRVLKATLHSN